MEKYCELFRDNSDYWSWSKKEKSMNTEEQPLNEEEVLDVESSEKKDCGIMDDSSSNDESNFEEVVTYEENLEVLSRKESCMCENTNDKMCSTSNEEVNEKFDICLGVGNNSFSQPDNLDCKCKDKEKESARSKKKNLFTAQDPFIYNINPEDFPVNLSESSSEDESDSTKEKTQQARSRSKSNIYETENDGTNLFSYESLRNLRSKKRNTVRMFANNKFLFTNRLIKSVMNSIFKKSIHKDLACGGVGLIRTVGEY